MGQSEGEIAEVRAHTDASLGAERTTSDAEKLASTADARRQLDGVVERDRVSADLGLLKFRDAADRRLFLERSYSPFPDFSISKERDSADQRKRAEREVSDALLQRERQRSDIAIEAERSERDALRNGLEARRQATDDELSTERRGADTTAAALSQTRSALAQAQTEEGRRHEVLRTVAHDLRTPLSVILMKAESIGQMTGETYIGTSAHAITLAVARMERVLTDLPDLAQEQSCCGFMPSSETSLPLK